MASILVGTNDLRAALKSVRPHACLDPELPSLCRIRLDVGPQNVTVTATDRFTIGLAIASVFTHLNPDTLDETTLPWVEVIDLAVDDVDKILGIFPGGKEPADEPQYLLRIETDPTHVVVTDSSGMIDGRSLKVPRLPADESFPDLASLVWKVHSGAPVLIENLTVGGKYNARFKAATDAYRQPQTMESTTGSKGLMIRVGESFLGLLMPIALDEETEARHLEWRKAWTTRLAPTTGQDDAA
ncbi:hypothetical protein P9990_17705 [Prescottella equi]|uniref:hypothetical protein n=1 Tax=Rhodococcus hoagii TaxID=43767 RepID=UPI002575E844|nr:hypothetical protein [Prescottella equi]WJJ10408.1 hypothetical protein P9990_17705 [Prescottella equi]